jgi:hypothetical protein
MAKSKEQIFFDKAATDPNIAKKSRGWFNKEVVRLRQMRPQPRKIMQQDGRSTRLLPGRLYMFMYEAKTADKLPYYDQFPLVFPFEIQSGFFLGLNMHYLPYLLRVRLLERLMTTASNKKMDDTTRLKFQWAMIRGSARLALGKPAVKKYLKVQVKSQFLQVNPENWNTAMMLPVERFRGATKDRVWRESLEIAQS